MVTWNNLDTLKSYDKLKELKGHVDIKEAMAGENGAKRVAEYTVPMASGLNFNYAAKQVDDEVLNVLAELAEEQQLVDKFEELYNGAVINTGEQRLVLHHLARRQLGKDVIVDGVNKRDFYVEQQKKAADFANKVHAGEITNEAGEKFTTVVQIGIGGSDLGPRALYIALENWAKTNGFDKMEAKFISNVDPDDAAAVLNSIDVSRSLFIVVSKSGTTLETLTNEAFVKDALVKAGLNPSKHMLTATSETSPLAKSDDYLEAFFMDDFIGGRYSSVSAVGGVILSLAFGPEVFARILNGMADEDKLATNKNIKENPDLLDALIGVYERNVQGYPETAVLPYSQALSRFPAHLLASVASVKVTSAITILIHIIKAGMEASANSSNPSPSNCQRILPRLLPMAMRKAISLRRWRVRNQKVPISPMNTLKTKNITMSLALRIYGVIPSAASRSIFWSL